MARRDDWTDRAAAVRPGEEIDLARLGAYLEREQPRLAGRLEIEQFPSGFSNLTYLVTSRQADGSAREMVLRRPPIGSRVRTAHDMGREFRILSALADVWSKAPRPLFYCDDEDVLGARFYAMERRRGLILRGGSADGGRAGIPDPDLMQRLAESLVATLVELHRLDYRTAGLQGLGRPEGYVERQVAGWTKRWTASRIDEMAAMDRVAGWLTERQPQDAAATLVHNDFKYDNLVFSREQPGRVIAVLDWEMATLGDPLMDLGTTLAYWADPDDTVGLRQLALSPTLWPGNPDRRRVAELYASLSGRECGELVFYYVFGLFKVAVIIQQIYLRYRQGLTQDERFARLGEGVEALAETASRALRAGRLDRLFEAA